MSNYAIKVMSCSRCGRISYVSSELLQMLIENLESEDLKPSRRGLRLVELGYMALDNGYYATALDLFGKALDCVISDGDMRKTRMTALGRHVAFRAAEGVDRIWRHMGSDSAVRKGVKEFFTELHYLRLGIDYDEALSEMNDFYNSCQSGCAYAGYRV